MVRILSGETVNDGVGTGSNVCAGSGKPVVVPVSEMYRPLLIQYLRDTGADDTTISQQLQETLYGVIEGVYRLWALLELRDTRSDQWRSFRWMVLIVNGSPSLECLRQMKRSFEENRRSENLIEVTLLDEYSRMQQENKRLTRVNGKTPSVAAVATAYDGRKHNSQDTVSQKVRTAMLLSEEVVTTLGEIMNKECTALNSDQLPDNHPAKSVDVTARYVDTRVFATLVTNNSFNGARLFLNNTGEENDDARLNTLFRLKLLSKERYYKPVQPAQVAEQYHMSRLACKESRKFETLLNTSVWPQKMLTMKDKLQLTSTFENELREHADNGNDILPCLFAEYRLMYPDDAMRHMLRYKSDCESIDVATNEDENEGETKNPEAFNDTNKDDDDNPGRAETESITDQQGNTSNKIPTMRERFDASTGEARMEIMLSLLRHIGIEAYNTTWQRYLTSVRPVDDPDFDLIFEDAPFGTPEHNPTSSGTDYNDQLEDSDFTSHAEKTFKCVKKGSFAFIITSGDYAHKWKHAMRLAGFNVWNGLFVLARSTQGRQLRKVTAFPQTFCDFAVIARKPGTRADNFKPRLHEAYTLLNCNYPRRLSIIDQIPVAHPKLRHIETSKTLRVSEKDVRLIMELFVSWNPTDGRIFDGFAGTLTTAIACLRTGRPCVVVEEDKICFQQAVQRLFDIYMEVYGEQVFNEKSPPTLLMQDQLTRRLQEDYERPNKQVHRDTESGEEYESDNDHGSKSALPAKSSVHNRDEGDTQGSRNQNRRSSADQHDHIHKGDQKDTSDDEERGEQDESLAKWLNETDAHSDTTNALSQTGLRATSSQKSGKTGHGTMSGNNALRPGSPADAKVELTLRHCRDFVLTSKTYKATLFSSTGEKVGTAELATVPKGEGENAPHTLRETFHGHTFDSFTEREGAHVIIRMANIDDNKKHIFNDGLHVGKDKEPERLADLSPWTFYLWPLSLLSLDN